MIRKMYCIETDKNSLYVDKDVYDYVVSLEHQCKKQKEVINNAMEYIEKLLKEEIEITDETNIYYGEKLVRPAFSDDEVEKIKDILNGEDKEVPE